MFTHLLCGDVVLLDDALADLDLHLIVDNYATHKHPKVRKWLAQHPRWTFHFTPTSASWLNAVEGFFAQLTPFPGAQVVDFHIGFNVVLGLQNHHDIGVGYEAMHDILHAVDSPHLKALYDAWAPALQGVDIETAATHLGSHTIHTTIADYQLRPRYKYQPALINYEAQPPAVIAVPMGEGFIDYRLFLRTLQSNGFRGSVAYEMCSPLLGGGSMANLDKCALRFLEWASESGIR